MDCSLALRSDQKAQSLNSIIPEIALAIRRSDFFGCRSFFPYFFGFSLWPKRGAQSEPPTGWQALLIEPLVATGPPGRFENTPKLRKTVISGYGMSHFTMGTYSGFRT